MTLARNSSIATCLFFVEAFIETAYNLAEKKGDLDIGLSPSLRTRTDSRRGSLSSTPSSVILQATQLSLSVSILSGRASTVVDVSSLGS